MPLPKAPNATPSHAPQARARENAVEKMLFFFEQGKPQWAQEELRRAEGKDRPAMAIRGLPGAVATLFDDPAGFDEWIDESLRADPKLYARQECAPAWMGAIVALCAKPQEEAGAYIEDMLAATPGSTFLSPASELPGSAPTASAQPLNWRDRLAERLAESNGEWISVIDQLIGMAHEPTKPLLAPPGKGAVREIEDDKRAEIRAFEALIESNSFAASNLLLGSVPETRALLLIGGAPSVARLQLDGNCSEDDDISISSCIKAGFGYPDAILSHSHAWLFAIEDLLEQGKAEEHELAHEMIDLMPLRAWSATFNIGQQGASTRLEYFMKGSSIMRQAGARVAALLEQSDLTDLTQPEFEPPKLSRLAKILGSNTSPERASKRFGL